MSHWNGTLYNWEVIDEYCDDAASDIGDVLTASSLRGWMYLNDYSGFNASVCLNAHRQAVGKRRYTLERSGWGTQAFHTVVRTPFDNNPKAITTMSKRQIEEFADRWFNEQAYRMAPVAANSRQGQKILAEARQSFSNHAALIGERVVRRLNELNGHIR